MKHAASKKARDAAVVLDVVRRLGPVSRVDIHQMTQLRPGTISSLVRDLSEEGWLVKAGLSNNPMGRKQELLKLNDQHRFVVGIEFDSEVVVGSVLDLRPRTKTIVQEETYHGGGQEGLVRQLLACTKKVIRQAGVRNDSLLGIGVADPGLIDSREGVTVSSSTIEFWKEVPLRKIFEAEFRLPFLLESNTRARTVAERVLGAGEMAEDMTYVDYGGGVGLGIISGGRILRGHDECAGEFGHTHVVENGPPCKCGSFGCLEAMVGAPAIAARARSAVLEGGNSLVLELADGDPSRITGWLVLQAAGLGDKMCGAIVEDVAKYLGHGLANLVNLFNPGLVILDQRLSLAGQGLLDQIIRIVKRQALHRSTQELAFRFSKLGADAGVLGIALLMLDRVFEIPALKPPKFMIESSPDAFLEAAESLRP